MANSNRQILLSGYNSLFQFIRLNKELSEGVDRVIQNNQFELEQLQTAVKQGHLNSELFNHPDCDLFLLALYKNSLIEESEFATCYKWLLMLMEFTNRQDVKVGDEGLKYPVGDVLDVNAYPCFQDGRVTQAGKEFIVTVGKKFEIGLKTRIPFAELEQVIKALPLCEQTIFKLRVKNEKGVSLLKELARLSPSHIFYESGGYKGFTYTFMAASSSIHRLFRFYELDCRGDLPHHVAEPLLAFGRVNEETILAIRRLNAQLITTYNKHVKRNLVDVHNNYKSLYTAFAHDEGHLDWRTIIPNTDLILNAMYDDYSKEYHELKNYYDYDPKEQKFGKVDLLRILLITMHDFVIDDIKDYGGKNKEERFYEFLFDIFSLNFKTTSERKKSLLLNPHSFDTIRKLSDVYSNPLRLYFVVAKICYQKSSQAQPAWEKIFEKMNSMPMTEQQKKVSQAICTLAKNFYSTEAIKLPSNTKVNVDWDVWRENLKALRDSKKIWDWACTQRQDELLTLINDCGLKFLDPFLPLTNEKYKALLGFVENQAFKQHASMRAVSMFPTNNPISETAEQNDNNMDIDQDTNINPSETNKPQ